VTSRAPILPAPSAIGALSALSAGGIAYEYPGHPAPLRALDGLDVDLCAGELAVVIGPNGSGKSTLVKVLAGLLVPSRGEVKIDGRPLAALAPRERARRIAVVPQFLPALPDVLVADFVLSGRYARLSRWRTASIEDRRAADGALAACDAADLADRSMTELSGGQRQRILIARAVAQEAAVLLVDEPTNALDPEHQVRTFDLLAQLSTHERAVLVVTHDMNLAGQYATRLVLLDEGRVVADGPPERVLVRAVLEPVYGAHLYYGVWPEGPDGTGRRGPFVLPCGAA
jgi:iron complex transport system ATP-binding protein